MITEGNIRADEKGFATIWVKAYDFLGTLDDLYTPEQRAEYAAKKNAEEDDLFAGEDLPFE